MAESAFRRILRTAASALVVAGTFCYFAAFIASKLAEDPLAKAIRLRPPAWQGKAGDGPVRIAVMPDIQNGLATMGRMLEEVRKLDPPADALVFTGDMVGHARIAHYATFLTALDEYNTTKLPCLFVAGNHEVDPGSRRTPRYDIYQTVFGAMDWRVDAGSCRLIGFGYREPEDRDAPPASVGLDDSLRGTGPPRAVMFLHVPILWTTDAFMPWENIDGATATLELIVAGHDHEYYEFPNGGVRQIVNGEGADNPVKGEIEKQARFLILDLAKDGVQVGSRTVPKVLDAAWRQWEFRRSWSNYALPWLRSWRGWLALFVVAFAANLLTRSLRRRSPAKS